MKLFNINKCQKFLKHLLVFLNEHIFAVFVILTLVIFALAGLIFYQYGYKVAYREAQVSIKEVQVNSQLYQKVMERFGQREKNIQEALNKNYSDPFR
jgi:hypothetical protein